MLNPENFYENLKKLDIKFFAGVPDSLLKQICACFSDKESENHIISANEGNAIALAAGYHLATKKLPLVYMQNSGLGNAVNPIVSLASDAVYSIPILLMIGWRGQPGVKDEPQHVVQGSITEETLNILGIEYEILSLDENEAKIQINDLSMKAMRENRPKAFLVIENTFKDYKYDSKITTNSTMTREEALEVVLENINENAYVFSTTGKTSREVFELREKREETHNRDFLTVGSMGHTSSIALAFSLYNKRDTICIDGDGALIMHLGSLAINSVYSKNNFKYILMNNYAHESVGGQKTVADKINFVKVFEAFGFDNYKQVSTIKELKEVILSNEFIENNYALEILVKIGTRKDLGRPTIPPLNGKSNLMDTIK